MNYFTSTVISNLIFQNDLKLTFLTAVFLHVSLTSAIALTAFFEHQFIFTQSDIAFPSVSVCQSLFTSLSSASTACILSVFFWAYVALCCDTRVQSLSLISGISDEPVLLNQYANDCRAAQSCQSGRNPLCCTDQKSIGTRERKDDRGGGREGDSQEVGGVVRRRRRRKERMWK